MSWEPNESKEISFDVKPDVGDQSIRIENSKIALVKVQTAKKLDMSSMPISTYCSAKAKPFEIDADQESNTYKIKASGSDFFHAEDSYAAVFLSQK